MRYNITQLNDLVVFEKLKSLSEIFLEELFDNLNTHDQIEHFINLLFKKLLKKGLIYNISHDKFTTIKNYLNNAFKKNWIRFSNNQINSSMLFIKKINNSLRLCVDYRDFNEIIIKNNYSLSLLSKILKRFAYAKHFIKINIRNAYYKIRIRKINKWKIVFRIRYNQFEYQIMPFNFANVSTIFQNYVNKTFKSYIDVFYVIYLNDILIYSKSKKLH